MRKAPRADLERMLVLDENGRLKARIAELEREVAWRDEALTVVARKLRQQGDTIAAMRGTDMPCGRKQRRAHARRQAREARRHSARIPDDRGRPVGDER